MRCRGSTGCPPISADRFAAQYTALRRREGWIGPSGREDPEGGEPRLWERRLKAVLEAAAVLRREWAGQGRPVLLDIGAGGGWAARYLPEADVIAIDVLAAKALPGEVRVRGDMRSLPVRDASVDVAFYAASLHYAPVEDSIHEASRVLRRGGLLVAVDSPMYRDARAQSRARERSTIYYSRVGFPELAAHYHPIDASALPVALARAGFDVRLLDPGPRAGRWWERPRMTRRFSILVARYA